MIEQWLRKDDVPPLPCIRCGKKLEPVQEGYNQPYRGTTFISYGHYGSTIFDSMNEKYIELNICDECINEVANLGWVITVRKIVPKTETQYEARFWHGWEDEER